MHLFTHLRAKVALLFSGALLWCGTAMADDGYLPQFSLNFETESTVADGWTFPNGDFTASQTETSSGSKALLLTMTSTRGSRKYTYSLTSASTAFANASDYKFEFDWGSRAGSGSSSQTQQSIMTISSSSAEIFTITHDYNTTVGIVSIGGTQIGESLVLDAAKANTAPTTLYHIVLAGNQTDGLTLTITNASGDVYVNSTIETFATPATISGQVAKNYGLMLFDDIILYEKTSKLANPTLSVGATSNEISISSIVEGGTIYYTIGSSETQNTYKEPFTLTEDATVTYWVEANGASSDKTTTETILVYGDLELQSDLNLMKAAWPDVTEDKTDVTLGTNALFTSDKTSFVSITIGTKQINGLYSEAGVEKWLKRTSANGGLYLFLKASRQVAIPNVQKGQLIEIYGCTGETAFSMSAVNGGELDKARTIEGSKYVFRASADGNLILSLAQTCYIDEVKIYGEEPIAITSKLNANTNVGTFYWSRTVAIPEGVKAFVGTLNDDKTELTLAEISDFIPANTPVILNAPGKTEVSFTAVDDIVAAITDNDLEGKLESVATSDIEGTVWVISSKEADGSDFGFHQYTGENITANRAYLVLPETASEAPAIRLTGDWNVGNVTGIETIAAEQNTVKAIYDIQGRRVLNANQPGLYIMGGKKVLVK